MDDVGHALQGGASPHKEDNGMSETLRIPAIVVIALPAAGCSLRVADHRASRQARDRQRRQRHRCGLPATSPVTVRMRSPEQMVSGRVACVIIGAGELVPVRDYPSADPILEVRVGTRVRCSQGQIGQRWAFVAGLRANEQASTWSGWVPGRNVRKETNH